MTSSRRKADRLTPEQQELWTEMQVHIPKPSGDQTPEQAINLAVLSFLFWVDFDGVGETVPTEAAIKAEFTALGAADACPSEDFWRLLRANKGYPWILAPGARRDRWNFELFGHPNRYRMEFKGGKV